MCYYMLQTTGVLDDLARSLEGAVRAGDLVSARRIYHNATGQDGAIDNSTWWTFCAGDRIRSESGISPEDVEKYTGYPVDVSDKRYFTTKAAMAARKLGGTWEVHWEY